MSAKVTVAAAPSARDGDGHLKGGTSKEAEVEGAAAAAAGHLKTRVGLDLESQADAAALTRLYDSMARETETLGLDSDAIRSLWSFYRSTSIGEEENEGVEEAKPAAAATGRRKHQRRATKPAAKRYSEFSPPLAPAAIRLLLFFLDVKQSDGDPGVALLRSAGDAAVRAALAELETLDNGEVEKERESAKEDNGNNPFPSLASAFHATPMRHMTVFQASHPASIVPDSTSTEEGEEGEQEDEKGNDDGGAGASTLTEAEEGKEEKEKGRKILGAPPEGALAREIAAARAAALAVGSPPRLVAHRVFLARSGALLLTLTEEAAAAGESVDDGGKNKDNQGGRVTALRREASSRMPRASKWQPAILHVTLGRMLAPLPTPKAAARVSRAAEEAARPFLAEAKERKKAWVPSALAHVVENTFASVDGESVLLSFSSS